MDSLPLVDTALRPMLDIFPTIDITDDNLASRRNRELPIAAEGDQGVDLMTRPVPGRSGAPDVPLHIFSPRSATGSLPCIYHIHGGGFVAGAAKDVEARLRRIVAQTGAVLISVDYRLAPETIFPGALEDCYAGLAWIVNSADELGIDIARLGVKGESAGGGLAAGLALIARDRREYALTFQHLTYPMIDDRTCVSADPHPYAGQFIWNPHNNHYGWRAILGCEPGSDGVSPYAAPARAVDLSALPPTFIATGALDLFVEENIDYARRLMRAGVPTEMHVYPGAFHGFDLVDSAPMAQAAWRDGVSALQRFVG